MSEGKVKGIVHVVEETKTYGQKGFRKRLVVLERLAHEFDIGHRYTETEVNDALRPFHLDVAALRRHLVDEDFLSREHADGVTRYWRSGGRM